MKSANVGAWALAALLTACQPRDEHAVAKVDGAVITRTEVASELRSLLWRRGETWNALAEQERKAARETALENRINARLLAQFAARQALKSVTIRRESEEEFQQFLKQFPPPDEWRERMRLQGLDEAGLRKQVGDATGALEAVERWLAQQPGNPTATEARAWFDSHTGRFTLPERVRASHIFLTRHDKEHPDRKPEIRELDRRLTAGEATFEELAAKHSEDESAKLRAGDLGWFTRDRVPPEFAEKVFALPVGEISAPFESHLGWHILVVKEKLPQRDATFEEASVGILAMLDREWRAAAVRRLLVELRSKARIERFADRAGAISPE